MSAGRRKEDFVELNAGISHSKRPSAVGTIAERPRTKGGTFSKSISRDAKRHSTDGPTALTAICILFISIPFCLSSLKNK